VSTALHWCVCHLFLETSLHSIFIVGYNVRDAVTSEIIAKIVFLSPSKVDSRNMYVCPDISCLSHWLTTVNFSNHQLDYLSTIRSFDGVAPSRDLVNLVHLDRCNIAGLFIPHVTNLAYANVFDIPRLVTQSQDICDLFAGLEPWTVEECHRQGITVADKTANRETHSRKREKHQKAPETGVVTAKSQGRTGFGCVLM